MRKLHKMIALILFLVIALSSLSFAFATVISNEEVTSKMKISDALLQKFESTKGDEVATLVWLTDIDANEAESFALKAVEEIEKVAPDAYSSRTLQSPTEIEKVQTYIRAKRGALEKQYTAYNKKISDELMRDAEILFTSRCAPMLVVKLDKTKAMTIADSPYVESIDYFSETVNTLDVRPNETIISSSINSTTQIALGSVVRITRAYDVKNSTSYGFTGEGILIGMVEEYVPSDLTSIGNVNLADWDGDASSSNSHAENTLSIMYTMAPDATYYAAGVGSFSTVTEEVTTKIMQKIEWLISDCNVNIINSSFTFAFHDEENGDTATYGSTSRWIDHLSYQHNVHFITSAGNGGSNGVRTSAMAYNAVAVGNLYVKGTTDLDDDVRWSGENPSAYYNGNMYANKPDLCAPGEGIRMLTGEIFNGTSAAAPQVTAAVALMCEQRPALLTQQKTVKAILAASVNFDSPHRYVPVDEEYKQYGAGLLDCVGACWVVGNYRYATGSMPANGSNQTHTFTVTNSDSRIRVALSWNIKSLYNTPSNSSPTHNNQYSYDNTLPDLNLKIKDPNGNYVKAADGSDLCSSTTNNNVEILDFVPTMTGTYTIVVTCGDNVTRTVPYSLAWR